MEANRPVVLSIAGFDPSGGAGLLADIKTFEQHKVYGLGIVTAQTVQTENDFLSVRWENENDVLKSLDTMLSRYEVKAVKIGITENEGTLRKIVSFVYQKSSAIKIVADTVIRSSSGFDFWDEKLNEEILMEILPEIFLITPNYSEALQLMPSVSAKEAAQKLSAYCNVLLKGGHNMDEVGIDYLFMQKKAERIGGSGDKLFAKHGSGCVLSAAITANLALGLDLVTACTQAKKYVEHFLLSNKTLLGYHHV